MTSQNQPFDVFISYNWDHKVHVRRLYDELTKVYGLRCWLDDIELKPGALMDELSKGINDSKVFLCCITKAYCKSQNCIGEINHARNTDKPMVILMLERLRIDTLGGVGFIIGPMIRINAYKYSELFEEATGDLFKQVISQVNVKLDEWGKKRGDAPTEKNNLPEMEFVRSLTGHVSPVLCLCELTRNRLASGSSDNNIIVWNLTEFTKIIELKAHSDLVTCLKSLSENRLASGSMDSSVIIWNLSSYEPIKVLKGHTEGITCLKVLPDKELCSGSNDYSMRIWNLKTYECIKEIRGNVKPHIKFLKTTKKKAIRLIDNTFKKRPSSESSETVSTATTNVTNSTEVEQSIAPSDSTAVKSPIEENTESIAVSYDNTSIAVTTITENTITIPRSKSSDFSSTIGTDKESRRTSISTFSNDVDSKKKGKKSIQKKRFKFVKSKERESMDSSVSGGSESINPTEDGVEDEYGGPNEDAIPEEDEEQEQEDDENLDIEPVIEEKSRKKKKAVNDTVNKVDGHTKAIYCLKNIKAPDADIERTKFASGSRDKLIKIWDLINYNCVSTLKGHTDFIICLKNLPKNRLASGSADKTIRIWELKKYTCLKILNGHTSDIQCLQTLSDNRLASGSCDTTIRIWNINTDKADKKKYECIKVIKEHTKYVNILKKYKTDRLISSSNDNIIKVWNLKSYEKIEDFKEHSKWISFILPLDSGRVSSCSWDSAIKVWKPKAV